MDGNAVAGQAINTPRVKQFELASTERRNRRSFIFKIALKSKICFSSSSYTEKSSTIQQMKMMLRQCHTQRDKSCFYFTLIDVSEFSKITQGRHKHTVVIYYLDCEIDDQQLSNHQKHHLVARHSLLKIHSGDKFEMVRMQ